MSTAAVDYRAPSLTFAQNHGSDRARVLTGPVNILAGSGSVPGPWYVTIPIQPFVYDPSSGDDLVVDIEMQGLLLGTSFHVDHVSGAAPMPALGTRLLTVSSGSPVGTSISIDYTPVTEFTFERLADYRRFGPGCLGSAGVPTNVATALPVLGGTVRVEIGSLPAPEIAVFCIGWSRSVSAFGPLPLDLAARGAPGCLLRVATDSPAVVLGSAGVGVMQVPVPADMGLLGAAFYTQAFAFDPTRNALGFVLSDAAVGLFGF
jgi:hypothetical protein